MRVKKRDREILGSDSFLDEKLTQIYGSTYDKSIIDKIKKDNRNKYLLLAMVFVVLMSSVIIDSFFYSPEVNINKDGELLWIERPEKGQPPSEVKARVLVKTPKGDYAKDVVLIVDPKEKKKAGKTNDSFGKETAASYFDRRILSIVRDINKETDNQIVKLPKNIDSYKVSFQLQRNDDWIIYAILIGLLAFLIYKTRNKAVVDMLEESKEEVVRELPEFINKLCLLLGSGLVFESAINRILSNEDRLSSNMDSYFYGQLRALNNRAREKNVMVERELNDFAKRIQLREFSKITSIIYEAAIRGTDLKFALARESEGLWFKRKKQAEKEGKISEIKLTLPLVILLFVLILITIAPAMMEM